MGFPLQWRLWIRSCVLSGSASILVNGSSFPTFKLQDGLKQGDPLSPFLFDFIIKPLNLIIQKALELSLWKGVEVSRGGLKISDLQYADDTIFFCAPKIEYLANIKRALVVFQLASGLQINFHKISLIDINVPDSWLHNAANTLL